MNATVILPLARTAKKKLIQIKHKFLHYIKAIFHFAFVRPSAVSSVIFHCNNHNFLSAVACSFSLSVTFNNYLRLVTFPMWCESCEDTAFNLMIRLLRVSIRLAQQFLRERKGLIHRGVGASWDKEMFW